MGKKRVYEIAKDYNFSSKEIMRVLKNLGIDVKSHMSTLSENEIHKFTEHIQKLQEQEASKEINFEQKSKKQRSSKNKNTIRDNNNEFQKDLKPERVIIQGEITVGELANKMNIKATEIIKKLMSLGIMANINQVIDIDTAIIVGEELEIPVEVEEVNDISDDPEEFNGIEQDPPDKLQPRAPVVTVMGHVDHGKTSLLDVIRKSNVTEKEAGGITQHIGAYQVDIDGKKITFLDTPGHEAFTSMRARGAQATDIAILVVAADDGVMPQTIEAINHARSAKVPIIVAINKIDRPEANPEKVKQQLVEQGLVPEEWGGDTICVPVSAVKKEGIDNLLEMIILVAEIEELKANPDRAAEGIVIEAKLDKGRGPVATVLVKNGTLKIGDSIVAGECYGKVRAMLNDKGKRIKTAGPSTPVEVLGLSEVPDAGETFMAMKDEKKARIIAEKRHSSRKEEELKKQNATRLEDFFKGMDSDNVKELNILIKADVHGSVEALKQSLQKLSTSEVKVNMIHGGVGAITETDVMLASASKAIIVGFNVRPDTNSRKAAEKEGVEIRLYRVIYELLDDIKMAMEGLLDPDIREVVLGSVEVRATFKVPKVGTIAGCYVVDGKVTNSSKIRVIRDGVVIHEGEIDSLKRFKDDAKEVNQGYECGISLKNFNDIKEGDIIEPYTFEEVKRKL